MYESNLCIKCRPIFKALKSTSFFFFHFWLRNLNLSGWNCSYWKVNVILCLYMFCLLLQWTKKWPKMQLPLQFAPQLFFTLCNGKNWINGLSFFSSKFVRGNASGSNKCYLLLHKYNRRGMIFSEVAHQINLAL